MGNGRRAMADGQRPRGNGNGQWQWRLANTVTGNPSIVAYKKFDLTATGIFFTKNVQWATAMVDVVEY